MSHIVTIHTEVRDQLALSLACERLRLAEPRYEEVQLFSKVVCGHAVRLPEWRYPVVCDLSQGSVHFDNYQGAWGDQRQLDRLLQSYGVCKATLEARRRGYSVTEQTLADGSVKLQVLAGGA